MYRCNRCGSVTEKITVRRLHDGSTQNICPICGSDDVAADCGERCHTCGSLFFDNDIAFESGGMVFCPSCLERVMM